jgi:hypothetical protein
MLLEKLSGKTMRWHLGVVPGAGFSTLKGRSGADSCRMVYDGRITGSDSEGTFVPRQKFSNPEQARLPQSPQGVKRTARKSIRTRVNGTDFFLQTFIHIVREPGPEADSYRGPHIPNRTVDAV